MFTSVDDGPSRSRGGNDTVLHECRALLAILVAGPVCLWPSLRWLPFDYRPSFPSSACCGTGASGANDVPDSGRPYAGDVLGRETTQGLTPAVGDSRSKGLPHSYGLIPLRANCRRCHASQDLGTSSFLDPTSVRNMSRSAFLCLAILRMPSLESVRPGRRTASSFMTHFCLLFRSKLMTLARSFVCQVGLLMPLLSALTPGRLMAGYSARSFRPS